MSRGVLRSPPAGWGGQCWQGGGQYWRWGVQEVAMDA